MKKNIFITGSTDGIGKLAAIEFAKDGHTVYLHGRNAEKLDRVIREIKAMTQNNAVKGFVADFSDLNAVQHMAAQCLETIPQLDVLVNNAGIFKSPIQMTKDQLDIRFSVNYLAPYIVTNTLLPLLEKGTDPRIINLSSAAQAPVSYDALTGKNQLNAQAAYAQSKLALTQWSFYLAKVQPHISTIAVNPGSLLNTRMANEAYGKHWSPAEKGGNVLVDLALSEKYEGISGRYFDNDLGSVQGDFGKAHTDAYDARKVEQLISSTNTILEGLLYSK